MYYIRIAEDVPFLCLSSKPVGWEEIVQFLFEDVKCEMS